MTRLLALLALLWMQAPLARPATPAAGAEAASCAPDTICAEFDEAILVFYARVAQVTPDDEDQKRLLGPLRPQVVNFDVLEDFKGTVGGTATLSFDLATPNGRTFTPNEQVLVYAKRTQDRSIFFAGCSRTRRVAPDDPELVTLRQLQNQIGGGSLEGELMIPPVSRPPALAPNHDLGQLPVSLQALDGSGVFNAISSPSGSFLIPWVKPGNYRFRFDVAGFVPVVRDITIADRTRCVLLPPIGVRPR